MDDVDGMIDSLGSTTPVKPTAVHGSDVTTRSSRRPSAMDNVFNGIMSLTSPTDKMGVSIRK